MLVQIDIIDIFLKRLKTEVGAKIVVMHKEVI